MQPLFEYPLELAGCRTRALELEGEGPPLLLLHGFADSADTWRLLLDRLGRRDMRALALDMPGFGTADPLDSGRPILEQLDEFAVAALEHLAPDGGAVVCGNSLGGCVALRLAERPGAEAVGRRASGARGTGHGRLVPVIERDQVLRALLAAPVPIPRPVLQRGGGQVYRRLVFRRPGDVQPEVARTFASHFSDRAAAGRLMATGRRMLSELRDCLDPEAISCPVLLIWGRQDVMVFQTGADRVIDAAPDARLVTIEACGHCSPDRGPRPAGGAARRVLRPPGPGGLTR